MEYLQRTSLNLENMSISPVNYVDFINNVHNPDQLKILMNIFTNDSVCYLTNTISLPSNTENIVIEMLGQQKGSKPRSQYKVTIDTVSRKLKCNCKDFIFRSQTKKIVCKHISFIVFRYAKIYSNSYTNTLVLSSIELAKLITLLKNNDLWTKYTLATFNNIDKLKDEDQECPICCEMLSCKTQEPTEIVQNEQSYVKIVSCPTCKNVVHEECIRKWLRYNKTCVYCRSNSWKDF